MPEFIDRPEGQDPSEAFDEDNFDPLEGGVEENRFRTFEDIPEVEDLTSSADDFDEEDDADDDAGAEQRFDLQAIDDVDGVGLTSDEEASDDPQADDEVELVFDGLLENTRGAQASAAHWEARTLSDDDIAELGYGPESTEQP